MQKTQKKKIVKKSQRTREEREGGKYFFKAMKVRGQKCDLILAIVIGF